MVVTVWNCDMSNMSWSGIWHFGNKARQTVDVLLAKNH